MIVKPVYTGVINGKPIRFFRSPLPGPRFPWHAHIDLLRCLDLPTELVDHFLRAALKLTPDTKSIATEDGILLIASHPVAQGLISAALECNPPTKLIDHVEGQYAQAGTAAIDVIGMTLEEMLQAVENS